MPDFWEFPTVSMGLGPIMAIYQARFNRYLEDRKLKPVTDAKVWAFLGDGETDEPESLGAITLASREKLDNLIFVINCNLQRLDGPVRGNGQIIQELEAAFRGAGWNVVKAIWGSEWDALLEDDHEGLLVKRMGEVVDGQYQKYAVESGAYVRKHFWGADPKLLDMVKHLSDEQLKKLTLGGHDPAKVYNAFKRAVDTKGMPTVVLARTIKGYGIGESGEGKNVTHNQKKMNDREVMEFRTRFGIPISDEDVANAPFYRPGPDSVEAKYIAERRQAMNGPVPRRQERAEPIKADLSEAFAEFHTGTEGRTASTTMVFVRMLSKLLREESIGKLVVPIVPDEARTFGMEALFRQVGIYAHAGQLYEPVDRDTLLYYKEAEDGQILEEGINEAGSMSSFIAAGTAYASHGINTIPFYIFYSMFGFQRVGDLIWAGADMRMRGFVVGGTVGPHHAERRGSAARRRQQPRAVAAGADLPVLRPDLRLRAGGDHRGRHQADVHQPGEGLLLPDGDERAVRPPGDAGGLPRRHPQGDVRGQADRQAQGQAARADFRQRHDPDRGDQGAADPRGEVQRRRRRLERHQLQQPLQGRPCRRPLEPPASRPSTPRLPYVTQVTQDAPGVFVAASDYLKVLPDAIDQWLPRKLHSLGTDGFGRSETRAALRNFFEVDSRFITLATLYALMQEKQIEAKVVTQAIKDLGIDTEKADPAVS